jgi:threonine synthase
MQYQSTRGGESGLSFEQILLAGLATDGGLYVPASLPQIPPQLLSEWARLPYPALAYEIIHRFTGKCIADAELRRLIDEAYGSFRHDAVAPLTQLSHNHFLLELFHGPTLAFKDFALQFLGRLIDHSLKKTGARAIVLGATSGDTGSAAIAGCAGSELLDSVILYPEGRVSEVQRRQMTTTGRKNVHTLAVKGTFDDCQDIVKTLFADSALRAKKPLIAVNSINWARILAQVVYYFYAALALGAPARSVSFSVPTGNFGDIFAGYIARGMGLPIERLIIATNRNDILARTLACGEYRMSGVHASLSPSMDIEISSNFERLLYDLYERDGQRLASMMQRFRAEKTLALSPAALADFSRLFSAHKADDAATLDTIRRTYETTGYVLDPHTATGVAASNALRDTLSGPVITLATAHPAKFPDAVERAIGQRPALPPHMADLFARAESTESITNSADAVRTYIEAL